MSGFFPLFSKLSGFLSRDWWSRGHVISAVWLFPASQASRRSFDRITREPKSGEIIFRFKVGAQPFGGPGGVLQKKKFLMVFEVT